MKQTLAAALALAAAAGFAGVAAAQTAAQPTARQPMTAPAASAPAPQASATVAPSTMAPQSMQGAAYPSNTAATGTYRQPGAEPQIPKDTMARETATPTPGGDFWSRNISQQEVQQAQEQLKTQGLYRGPADGIMGSATKRAILQYQRRNGLTATATLDEATLGRLTNTTSGVGSSAPSTPESSLAPLTAGTSSGQPAYEQTPPAAKPMYR